MQSAANAGPQVASQANTYVVTPGEGIPHTADEWRGLMRLRSELSDQIGNVQSRRQSLANQLKSADPSARQGLIDRIKVMDDRLVRLEQELDRTGTLQRNTPLSVINAGAGSGPGDIVRNVGNDIVPIIAILSVFVLGPMAIAMSRFIWRRAGAPPQRQILTEQAAQQRLDQLQHAVDTIAIEVERISEGQRFISKVLSDRALPAGSAEPVRQASKAAAPATRG